MSKLKQVIDELKKAKEEANKRISDLFHEYVVEFFNHCPQIKTISWNQYTPSYNDGDPCYFRIGDVLFSNVEGLTSGDYDEEDEELIEKSGGDPFAGYSYSACEKYESIKDKIEEFSNMIGNSELEEFFEETYGDGVTVIITKDKIETEEYYHD